MFMNNSPTNLLCLPAKSRRRLFYLLLIASNAAIHHSHAGSPLSAGGYYCWDGLAPNQVCSRDDGNNTVCDYDTIVWDNVILDIRQDGIVPGQYVVTAKFPFDNNQWDRYFTINDDGTVTYNPNNDKGFWAAWAPGAGSPANPTVWTVGGTGVSSVDADGQVTIGSYSCDGSATTIHATVRITIGSPNSPPRPPVPTPTPGRYDKNNDEKRGGNQHEDCPGMARYSVHSLLCSLNVVDTPLRYQPPYGPPVDCTVTYNQLDTQQPATFSYSNFGPKWTFDWLSYVTDDPNVAQPILAVYVPGGGSERFTYDKLSQAFPPDPQSHAILVKTGPATYERDMPDGSKFVYSINDGAASYPRRVFMTGIIDAAGNALAIGYDSLFRIIGVTDALGRTTTLSYELSGDPFKVTKVTDPFGRFSAFGYSNGQLTTITDEIGIQSQFGYSSGSDSINSLTTPYGTTNFASGAIGTNRWLEITDPNGGKERFEYRDNAPGISATEPVCPNTLIVNAGLDVANSFYWDKKAMSEAPGDYTKAEITHWLYEVNGQVSGIASSRKKPLENRVWYAYDGQQSYQYAGSSANPNRIATILGDGTTQARLFSYNSLGNVTKATDPLGRITMFNYDANNIDLLRIYNIRGIALLRTLTYNTQHLPLTDTDAAGQTTTHTYSPEGQLLTTTNAKGETTTYSYGGTVPVGCLASITSPPVSSVSAVTTFAYDSFNRVRTVTDADSYSITTDYDNLDRKTKVTYPDGTFEQFQYTDNVTGAMTLDLTGSRDRRGLWTYRHYNANEQMDSITAPLGLTTQYGYCTCGALTSITDPKGQTTIFNRDIQSRVYQKVFADNTTIDYLYEGQVAPNTVGATSRLQSSTDANGQITNYDYFADDNLKQVSYANALNPTATVSYSYDPKYNRTVSMTDGIGTTTYTYYPIAARTLGAGRLQQVDGPFANDTITYAYDELGRVTGQDVNGMAASMSYDSLGRLGTTTNALGSFTRAYDGVTPRLLTINYPNGQSGNYSYYGNEHDRRLQTMQYLTASSANLSRHNYAYDADGEIQTWNKTLGSTTTNLSLGYDDAGQLVSAAQPGLRFDYSYDEAGNRIASTFRATHSHGGDSYTANGLNQLDSVTRDTGVGAAHGAFPLTYDRNGNMTYDGGNQTYEWDAANRLIAINYLDSGNRTAFAYDGLGRRVKIAEYNGIAAATIAPDRSDYASFSTAPFTLAASGNYTLVFQGLGSAGDSNTVLLDAVTLNDAAVSNGSFESPTVSDYEEAPTDTSWSFVGHAGIAANGGTYTSSNPDAPDGTQVAYVKSNGLLRQTTSIPAGTYTLSFAAAQGGANDTNQQVRVSLWAPDAPASVKTFVWSGNTIAEERDSTGATVTKRFFAEGEQRIGGSDAGNYYYTRDHLGSIREVTDSVGAMKARYDYDAWGNESVVAGNMNIDFGFTGHYYHQPSRVNLTMYRAYSAALARWLSRDPIGEQGGLNLYGYVRNEPLCYADPLGLWQATVGGGGELFGAIISFGYSPSSGQISFGGFFGFGTGLFGELDFSDSGRQQSGWNDGARCHAEAGAKILGGKRYMGISGDSGGAYMENGGARPTFAYPVYGSGRPFTFGPAKDAGSFGAGVGAVIGVGVTWTTNGRPPGP